MSIMTELENRNGPAVMVCLSGSPSCQRVIRAAARLVTADTAVAVALYVRPAGQQESTDYQLQDNFRFARQNGFDVQTLTSADIPLSISEYAKRLKITDLFVGSSAPQHLFQPRRSMGERLMNYLPETDIHIIPDSRASDAVRLPEGKSRPVWNIRDFLTVVLIMTVSTLLSVWFDQSRFSNANIITIYLLAVLVASLLTSHQFFGILAAVLYILLFNFLFIDPRFTLLVYDPEYLVTYLVTLAAALISSSLAIRMKNIARISAENAYQARVLLSTTEQLEQAGTADDIMQVLCLQLKHLLNRTIRFYSPDNITGLPEIYAADDQEPDLRHLQKEKDAVQWTFVNDHHSGAYTSHFPDYLSRYFSLYSDDHSYGVIGVEMNGRNFTDFESTILQSIVHEGIMALDKERIDRERNDARAAAEKERLRAGLLRSLSHDLRTPLTSISGNAANLAAMADAMSPEDRQRIYEDMEEDASWLKDQMENILAMTRLGSDSGLNLSVESAGDVIAESLRHIHAHPDHKIRYEPPAEDCLAKMDAKLIMQVLINLLDNAVKHTPAGTEVTVTARKQDGRVEILVADTGQGIPDAEKENIFELFYTGRHTLSDSSRSMGIGLNLCREILKAHGGTIEVADNQPHGTVFTLSLKAWEAEA